MIPKVSPRRRAKRLSLSAKKKLHPERYCCHNRCFTAPSHIGRCTTHAKEHLDRLLRSLVIRPDSECEAAEWHASLFPCGGDIQVNHVIERELLLTRWRLENVFPGCRDFNLWTKNNPRKAARIFKDWRGADEYDELDRLAISGAKPDYEWALRTIAHEAGGTV